MVRTRELVPFLDEMRYELFGQFLEGGSRPSPSDLDFETKRLAETIGPRLREHGIIIHDGRISGVIYGTSSAWDTKVLGISTAKIPYCLFSPALPHDVRLYALKSSLHRLGRTHRLVVARIPLVARNAIDSLVEEGAVLTDVLLTFRVELTDPVVKKTSADQVVIGPASEEDSDMIKEISRSSFRAGHFHADPKVPKSAADNVYATISMEQLRDNRWEVAKAQMGSELVGFVSYAKSGFGRSYKYSQISLLAVATGKRKKGVATELVQYAMNRMKRFGSRSLFVSTQATNLSAVRLYERTGFVASNAMCTFHIWLH